MAAQRVTVSVEGRELVRIGTEIRDNESQHKTVSKMIARPLKCAGFGHAGPFALIHCCTTTGRETPEKGTTQRIITLAATLVYK